MPSVQQWGRKESIIWPPRGYVYTLGAFIFACILAGIFVYFDFNTASPRSSVSPSPPTFGPKRPECLTRSASTSCSM
jgi:hypothetical protein